MVLIPLIAIIVFGTCLAGISFFIRWSRARNILAFPNERSLHSEPVPVGAGLVLVVVCVAAFSFYRYITGEVQIYSYIVGSVIVAAVSWWDDLRKLPVPVRFGIQSLAALLAISGLGHLQGFELPFLPAEYARYSGMAITYMWIVGLTNAYNFMDGIDGIAGLQGSVAGVAWGGLGLYLGSDTAAYLGFSITAASVAFLVYNWQPAKVFLGDVGSAFFGYSFAVLPLFAGVSGIAQNRAVTFAAVAFVWPFVMDSSVTFFRRLLKGEMVWKPHKSHFYQRMVISGRSHAAVAALYGTAAAVCSTAGFITVVYGFAIPFAAAGILLTGIVLFVSGSRF